MNLLPVCKSFRYIQFFDVDIHLTKILLSEGMDPVSRRFVWRHLDEVKRDRVILLTTHAMEVSLRTDKSLLLLNAPTHRLVSIAKPFSQNYRKQICLPTW